MAERPRKAPPADTPCEGCGEALGESWGVKRYHFDAGIGNMSSYEPWHSSCWWEANPDAVELHNAVLRGARESYELKRDLTRREKARAEKKRAEQDRKVS